MMTKRVSTVLVWFALSCGGASTSSNVPESDAKIGGAEQEDPKRASSSSSMRRADESAPQTNDVPAPSQRSNDGETADKAHEEDGPFHLDLPQNDAFLRTLLPEKVPGRYKNWRQQKSISVGKSHLHHASFIDGERTILAQSGAEGSVRVYDRKTGRLVARHDFDYEQFREGFLLPWEPLPGSPPGVTAHFALADESGIYLHEVISGKRVSQLAPFGAHSLKLSPDKSILVARAGGQSLHFFHRDSETRVKELGTLEMEERVDGWDLSRDNSLLAVSYYPSNLLVVYDLRSGREVLRVPGPDYVGSVAFSPNGRWLAAGGQGLLLVDLLNPARRAYYSYYYNNINTVRFSPSGDALATSSYDGHIRLFHYDSTGPSLRLIRALLHSGRANVYRIQFDEAGNHLVSASGDQTVRIFGATPSPTSRSPEHDEFRSLAVWRSTIPKSETQLEPRPPPSMKNGHYHPRILDEKARPTRVRPGKYACRVSTMYKLRDCTVTRDAKGHTMLEFHGGNLLTLRGVLYDDGPITRYEAWQTSTSTVVGCPGCEQQPLHGIFKGNGGQLSGLLTFRNYYDAHTPPPRPEANVKFEEADDRFLMTLQLREAFPVRPPPKRSPDPGNHEDFFFPIP